MLEVNNCPISSAREATCPSAQELEDIATIVDNAEFLLNQLSKE